MPLVSNPLTDSPTDVLTPNAPALPKGAPSYMADVLKAHEEAGGLANLQEQIKGKQTQMQAEGTTQALQQYAKEHEPAALKSEYDEKIKKMSAPFIPNERTAGDLGLIFTLTNILGFGIGRGAKGSAQAALAAQNGMLEGWQKGDMDAYKKQKDIFEENQKALKSAVEGLRDELARAEKTASINKELSLAQVQEAVAKYGADTIGEYLKTHPLSKTVDLMDNFAKMMGEIDKRSIELRRIANEEARTRVEQSKVKTEQLKAADKVALPMIQGVRSIEGLQDQLRNPNVQAGLKARLSPFFEKIKSLSPGADASEWQNAVNESLTGTDETTLFLKDALLTSYDIERAAKGNQRLTVQDMKTVGPVLDPTNYTPQAYNALLETRRRDLYNKLQDIGYTPDLIKQKSAQHPYESYGGQVATPTEQDRQALEWANKHPDDPKAVKIKELLGVKGD